jgi:putative DNA primase/helicase
MSTYVTFQNNQISAVPTPYADFKQFKKHFNGYVSGGYTAVYQTLANEATPISMLHFEFEESNGTNIIDKDAIGRMVYAHQEVISQTTGVTSPTDLTCFVMTQPQIETPAGFVENIYFQFPYFKVPTEYMPNRMLPSLKAVFTETGLHERGLDIMPTNDIDSIISSLPYSQKVWPMPGSYIDGSLLSLSYVFDRITVEQAKEAQIPAYTPEAYFMDLQMPDKNEYDNSNSFYFTNLEGFEMIKRKKTQREKNRDVTSRLIEERQKEVKRTFGELCKIFLDMLAPTRFAQEVQRNKVGQVLFNVLKRGGETYEDEGLQLWKDTIRAKLEALNASFPTIEQLQQANPMVEEQAVQLPPEQLEATLDAINVQCDEAWQYFEFTDSTIGTLKYWAKLDNPEQYKAFLQKDVMTLAWRCLNPTSSHTDVARLMYAKYSDQFVCANIKDNVWFGFWNHRWHELDKCYTLRIKLSEEIVVIFEKILNDCNAEYKKAISDEDKERWARYEGVCSRMIKDLKTVAYKSNIVTECAERFYDPDFIRKLDEDRMLLGVTNGVYELETGLFRLGKPEDFITLCTSAKYNANYSWDHPRVRDVVYYMKTVYPDIKLRHYIQKAFGTILEGGNMNKDFYNMVGEGDNSKSMVAKLIKLAMGKYISKIPVSMIMGKRGNADNATPHLADKKGIRALFVEEPPKGQSNVSVVKELSGNDDVLARALFKMPVVFSPQWKLFVFTNHMLEAPAEEKAYWNRQKVVDHESTFSFDAPPTIEEQFAKKMFPRDPSFDKKLIAMAEPMLWCMIEWYGHFKREGLVPPERVLHATNLAKLRNDIYLQYIRASLDQGTQHEAVPVDDMFVDFKTWHQTAYNNKPPPTKQDFEDEMCRQGHLGHKPIERRWIGVKFKAKISILPSVPLPHN